MTFDTRLTELITLGAATAANCAACLEHHVGKAREIGLPAEEVEAALEVGRRVRQGAAGALDRVAARLGMTASAVATSAPTARAARSCCG
jgi:AhpD family alkylhydroperoxidase